MIVKVTYKVLYTAEIEVDDTQTIEDAATDINIPEDGVSKYVDDSFEVIRYRDENGDDIDIESNNCRYCGGNCPSDEENCCDGYSGDIYGLYTDDSTEI